MIIWNRARLGNIVNVKKAEAIIQEARGYIRKGETEVGFMVIFNAFDLMQSEKYIEIKNHLEFLESRYHNLKKKIWRGSIEDSLTRKEENSINEVFFDLLNHFRKMVVESPSQELTRLIEQTDEKNREVRTDIITSILKLSVEKRQFGIIREKGNFSSFSLPNRPVTHPAWEKLNWKDDEDRSFAKKLRLQRYCYL